MNYASCNVHFVVRKCILFSTIKIALCPAVRRQFLSLLEVVLRDLGPLMWNLMTQEMIRVAELDYERSAYHISISMNHCLSTVKNCDVNLALQYRSHIR